MKKKRDLLLLKVHAQLLGESTQVPLGQVPTSRRITVSRDWQLRLVQCESHVTLEPGAGTAQPASSVEEGRRQGRGAGRGTDRLFVIQETTPLASPLWMPDK